MTHPPAIGSNSLPDLAARIQREHEAVGTGARSALEHAIACGQTLIEAKDQLEHGEWESWLRKHCPQIRPRTASHYMRLAKRLPKSASLADLSVTKALDLLAQKSWTLHFIERPVCRGRFASRHRPWPVVISACADCGVGTIGLGEWYMVHDALWHRAWMGRLKPWHEVPGQQILCIGCLENRLGRTLSPDDFIANPNTHPCLPNTSSRLRARLTRH
jgi:hypothetical protein